MKCSWTAVAILVFQLLLPVEATGGRRRIHHHHHHDVGVGVVMPRGDTEEEQSAAASTEWSERVEHGSAYCVEKLDLAAEAYAEFWRGATAERKVHEFLLTELLVKTHVLPAGLSEELVGLLVRRSALWQLSRATISLLSLMNESVLSESGAPPRVVNALQSVRETLAAEKLLEPIDVEDFHDDDDDDDEDDRHRRSRWQPLAYRQEEERLAAENLVFAFGDSSDVMDLLANDCRVQEGDQNDPTRGTWPVLSSVKAVVSLPMKPCAPRFTGANNCKFLYERIDFKRVERAESSLGVSDDPQSLTGDDFDKKLWRWAERFIGEVQTTSVRILETKTGASVLLSAEDENPQHVLQVSEEQLRRRRRGESASSRQHHRGKTSSDVTRFVASKGVLIADDADDDEADDERTETAQLHQSCCRA